MSELPLGLALDSLEVGTVVVNAAGVITFCSRSFESLLGIPRAQALGRHVTEVMEHTCLHTVARTGRPATAWAGPGPGCPTLVHGIPVRDEAGRVVGAVGQAVVDPAAALAHRVGLLEAKLAVYERELADLRAGRRTGAPRGAGTRDGAGAVEAAEGAGEDPAGSGRQAQLDAEHAVVLQALRMCKGNKAEAARLLGVERSGLYQQLARLAL
jgi:transcriptional regulator with PAS, ATPase and Fis domain